MDEQQPNSFPTGSPGGSPTGGGAADIPGVEVALRMVAATEAAARAAQKTVEMVESAASRTTGDDNKSWWKLLPKPPNFDHSTREAEISGWKEWSWMFEQYVASIDSRFTDDRQGVRARLDQPIDTVDFLTVSGRETTSCIVCYHLFFVNEHSWWSSRSVDRTGLKCTVCWSNKMSQPARTGAWDFLALSWLGPHSLERLH